MKPAITLLPHHKLLFVIFSAIFLTATRPVTVQEKYIEQFKWLAIQEMERTGIPASIKMAQALHESQSGRSELATNANNHFGIKCKANWTGDTYQYKDDDKDQIGNLIFSCFRSYSSAMDSYLDHSDFIKFRPRYSQLFELPANDYKAWAYGLKKCGYATDPNYPERLIRLIEKYNLDLLDQKKAQSDFVVTEEPKAILASENAIKGIPVDYLTKEILPLESKKPLVKSQYKKSKQSKKKLRKKKNLELIKA
ncbi:MAG: glucosaminidase domain-containing protein [Saprospiraceae bacterium]|nr:glucosaminidase domain-containing protein [Saprospiraceae bacterium]